MSETNGDEPIQQTAPVLPWEISLKSASWWFQRMPGGGMILKFIPTTPDGSGNIALMPPAVEIVFGDTGWRRFQEEVELGEKKPEIPTALHLPRQDIPRKRRR